MPASDEQEEDIFSDISIEELDNDLLDEEPKSDEPAEPKITDSGWSDYVLKQLSKDEQDAEGHPNVAGLRRLTVKLLGPIMISRAHIIQSPSFFEREHILQPATVEYEIGVLWHKDSSAASMRYFRDVADVYYGNTEAKFARYPTAMASTRAEARCYRKALQLRAVSAEELTEVPIETVSLNGKVTDSQIMFIDILSKRNDINVMKLVNKGRLKQGLNEYKFIEDVPYEKAEKINQYLSELQSGDKVALDDIKGYNKNWRKK